MATLLMCDPLYASFGILLIVRNVLRIDTSHVALLRAKPVRPRPDALASGLAPTVTRASVVLEP